MGLDEAKTFLEEDLGFSLEIAHLCPFQVVDCDDLEVGGWVGG